MDATRISGRTYRITWLALLALSALTLLLSFAPLGRLHVPAALLIAGTKATLVVLFFMHLAEQRATQRVVILVWLALLAILVALTAADVASRWLTERPPAVERSTGPGG